MDVVDGSECKTSPAESAVWDTVDTTITVEVTDGRVDVQDSLCKTSPSDVDTEGTIWDTLDETIVPWLEVFKACDGVLTRTTL